MSCTQCGYHFCWQCMGKFGSGPKGGTDGYSNHRCNKSYTEDEDVLKKKEELERFNWYLERYNNHARSRAIEAKQVDNQLAVVSVLSDEYGLSHQGCEFYRDALKQLMKNRHILMQSYIFGYFRPLYAKDVHKDIFENIQRDLELHSEKLSDLLQNTEPEVLYKAQKDIVNQTRVAAVVLAALLDSASEWSANLYLPEVKLEDKTAEPTLVISAPAKKLNFFGKLKQKIVAARERRRERRRLRRTTTIAV